MHESTICRFLKCNDFSRKKLSSIARQQNAQRRAEFQVECELYSPEMLIFVDETGCDRRDAMRRFGYSLKGTVQSYCNAVIAGMEYRMEQWNGIYRMDDKSIYTEAKSM